MVTSYCDKDAVENDESCFCRFGDYRVRHEKAHLLISLIKVILVIMKIPFIIRDVQRWKNVQTVQTRLCYFFSLAVLICWLCTHKLYKTLC